METVIEGITDVFEQQGRLNRKKRNLQRRDDQTAADWLELAEEYKAIDSRANMAFCTSRAERLDPQPVEEKEEWWQK